MTKPEQVLIDKELNDELAKSKILCRIKEWRPSATVHRICRGVNKGIYRVTMLLIGQTYCATGTTIKDCVDRVSLDAFCQSPVCEDLRREAFMKCFGEVRDYLAREAQAQEVQ